MAKIQLDVLNWPAQNARRRVFYNSDGQSTNAARSITVEAERIDPSFPAEPVGAEVPQRSYAPGSVVGEPFCEGTDLITLTATSVSPYASISVEQNAAYCTAPGGNVCDLFAEVVSASGSTIVFDVRTSHPPFSSSSDGITFEEGKAAFTGLAAGETTTFYFRDALNCTYQRNAGIVATPSPGVPDGVLIDSFEEGGETISLYYQATPSRQVVFYSPSGRVLVGPVDAATRNRAEGDVFSPSLLCEGTTQVQFQATLTRPFAQVVLTANAAACGYTPPVDPGDGEDPDPEPTPVRGCTDPNADNYDPDATEDDGSCTYTPVAKQPHFMVPLTSSLRFVHQGGHAFDNTLLRHEQPINYTNPGYCQLVEQQDLLVLQLQSNYANEPTCTVHRSADNTVAATFTPIRVVQGAGRIVEFSAYIRPDTTAGKVRVYFNADQLPLPFVQGNRVTLSNAGTLNGTYPIAQVLEDTAAAVPYLLLTAAYPTGAQRVDCTLSTTYVVQQFDTWQVVVPMAGLLPGGYYVRLAATDPELQDAEALSEPLDVAVRHVDTVVVAYRNFDNAFQTNYTAGIVNRLRVRARLFERTPATEEEVLRQSNDSLVLLSARFRRHSTLEVYLVPGWLHEKLALAFSHDFVTIDGLRWVRVEAYQTTPVPRYTLSNGGLVLEQYQLLGAGNQDDLGDVDAADSSFLIVNANRLLING